MIEVCLSGGQGLAELGGF